MLLLIVTDFSFVTHLHRGPVEKYVVTAVFWLVSDSLTAVPVCESWADRSDTVTFLLNGVGAFRASDVTTHSQVSGRPDSTPSLIGAKSVALVGCVLSKSAPASLLVVDR